MTTAPFARIFWKEYRSLRMLWLGCALGTLALWAFIGFISYVTSAAQPNSSFKEQLASIMPTFWGFSIYLPAVYLIGCLAATFAGEREERTDSWLINLAVPRGSTLAAKVIWPLLSATLMQWILLLLTYRFFLMFDVAKLVRFHEMVSWSHQEQFWQSVIVVSTWYTTFALLEALAWGVFFSTQTRKPMFAAIFAGGTFAVINLLFSLNLLLSVYANQSAYWSSAINVWGGIRTTGVVLILVVDYFLARRWLRGQPWEWSIPWDRFISRRKIQPIAAIEVEANSAWQRAWKRFRWLEWQQVRLFLMGTVVLTCLEMALILYWPQVNGSSAVIVILLYFLPMLAGLMAWSGEQTQQQFRFFVYRGVSPYALWLNKFCVWACALILAALLVMGIEGLAKSFVETKDAAFWIALWNPQSQLQPGSLHPISILHALVGYLTFFTGAFTVSLFFRRTVIAFGAAFLLVIAILYWMVGAWALQFHWALSVLPVMVWLVWCGWRQLPRWYLERTGWRFRAMISAEWLVFPILFSFAMVAYWIYQVPLPDVKARLAAHYHVPFETLEKQQLAAAPQWQNMVGQLGNVAGMSVDGSRNENHLAVTSEASDAEVRAVRDVLLQTTPGFVPPKDAPSFHAVFLGAEKAIKHLMDLAQRDLDAGRSDESIRSVRASVRFGGVFDFHSILHEKLTAWAASPANTPKIIAQTLAELEKNELRWWITDPQEIVAPLAERTALLDHIPEESGWKRWLYLPAAMRERRILACIAANQIRFLTRTPPNQRNHGGFPPSLPAGEIDPAWEYRDDRWGNQAIVGLQPLSLNYFWQRETQFRCTCAALAAIAYRKAHGEFPRTLEDVVTQIATKDLLTDPYSGKLLAIEPDGLSGELFVESFRYNNRISIKKDYSPQTPFIWSSGPENAILSQKFPGQYVMLSPYPAQSQDTYSSFQTVHVYRILPEVKDDAVTSEPHTVKVPDPAIQSEPTIQPAPPADVHGDSTPNLPGDDPADALQPEPRS